MDIFSDLDSNDLNIREESKSKLRDQFNSTKEPWLINGLYDYYVSDKNARVMEILVSVREPHDKYLFDRIHENLRNRLCMNDGLDVLGQVIRKQPPWLFKIADHPLFKELIHILKNEEGVVSVISGLLILDIALPLIPGSIPPYLQDIFKIFSRFAAWNTNHTNRLNEGQLTHLQLSLYTLFNRLYGMYPINFVSFLRDEYSIPNNQSIFSHTVKPMLETVRLNTNMIIQTKEAELSTNRWKKLEAHDIVVNCGKLLASSKDSKETNINVSKSQTNQDFKHFIELLSRSCNAIKGGSGGGVIVQNNLQPGSNGHNIVDSPSVFVDMKYPQSAPTSIPHTPIPYKCEASLSYRVSDEYRFLEKGIEATPENTPQELINPMTEPNASPPNHLKNEADINMLLNLGTPTSILQDEPPASFYRRLTPRLAQLTIDRSMPLEEATVTPAPLFAKTSNETFPNQPKTLSNGSELVSPQNENHSRSDESNEESSCSPSCGPNTTSLDGTTDSSECDDCETYQSGSSCPSGGLHMPNRKSMANFVGNMQRLRYNSYNATTDAPFNNIQNSSPIQKVDSSRRSVSCPNMNKENSSSAKVKLCVTDKTPPSQKIRKKRGNLQQVAEVTSEVETNRVRNTLSASTQTEDISTHEHGYEHLFLSVFPMIPNESVDSADAKRETSLRERWESTSHPSQLISDYINAAVSCYANKNITHGQFTHGRQRKASFSQLNTKTLVDELQLLKYQLQFEEYQRELHAERNRRLLGRSRNNRTLDEHNSALQDRVNLLQRDYEAVSFQVVANRNDFTAQIKQLENTVKYWQDQCTQLQKLNKGEVLKSARLSLELKATQENLTSVKKELDRTKAKLFEMRSELEHAKCAVSLNDKLRGDIATLQKELLISGEMLSRYKEAIIHLSPIAGGNAQATLTKDACLNETQRLSNELKLSSQNLEVANARIALLEAELLKKDEAVARHKSTLMTAVQKHSQDINAHEQNYSKLKSEYNQQVERNIELEHKLLIAKTVNKHTSVMSQKRPNSVTSSPSSSPTPPTPTPPGPGTSTNAFFGQ